MIGSSSSADHAIPFYFQTDNDSYYGFMEIGRNECDFLVDDVHRPASALCTGSKVHVLYEVTFHASNGRVRILLDGNVATDMTGQTIAPASGFSFGIGLDVAGTHPSIAATYDNVTLR